MRSSATLVQCFWSSGTTIRLWTLPVEQPFEHPQQMVRRHAEHRRAQAAELVERHDGLRGCDLGARAG